MTMKNSKLAELHAGAIAVVTAGIVAAAIGLLAMFGWILKIPLLASFGTNLIPMAPSTALLFILMGIAVSLRTCLPQNRGLSFINLFIGWLVAIMGLVLFISSLAGYYPRGEHLGFSINSTLNGFPVGHMSLSTAICFLACALSFLLTFSQPAQHTKRAWLALALPFLVSFTSLLFLIAYLLVSPLMYGGGAIPPSLPTSLAFLSLAFGQLVNAGNQIWSFNKMKNAVTSHNSYLLFSIFILMSAGILTGSYFAYQHYERKYRTEVELQLSAIADLKVAQIEAWRKERLGDGKIFYKNDLFSAMVKQFIHNKINREAKTEILTWVGQFQRVYNYDLMMLLDAQMNTILEFPENKETVHLIIDQKSTEELLSGNIAFQDFYRNDQDHRIYLIVLVPILEDRSTNRLIAVLALRISPEEYLYPLIKKWPIPSRTAESLIIRKDGNDALFLNDLKYQKDAALNLRISLNNRNVPAVEAALGKEGICEGIDYRGVPVVADVRTVPDSPWFLVARMDMQEVYAPLRERLWWMIIIIGALLLSAGASVAYVWRQQRSRFYQEQYKSAEALLESEEKFRTIFENSSSAMAIIEQDTTISMVNSEYLKIGLFDEQDIIGKSWTEQIHPDDLERLKEYNRKRLIDPASAPDQYEFRFIRKDGEIRNSILSVALIPAIQKIVCSILDITERKRTEEALRESENRYRRLFEAARDGILILDADTGMITDVNPFLIEMLGYTHEQFLGKKVWELGFFKDIVANEEKFTELKQKEYVRYEDLPLETADGRRIDAEFVSNLYQVDHHNVIQCNIRDITERVQAEELLKKSEELYRSLFENMLNGFAHCKMLFEEGRPQDFLYLNVNKAFESLTGLKDVVGKKVSEVIPGIRKADPGLFEIYGRVALTGKPEVLETYLESLNMWFSISVYSPQKEYFVSVFDVITERKQAEEKLRKSEGNLRQTFDLSPVGIVMVGLDKRFIRCNNSFAQFLGYQEEELIGKSIDDITLPEDSEKGMVEMQSIINGEIELSHVQKRYVGKKGQVVWGEVTIALVRDNQNLPHYFLATIQDITKRKLAENLNNARIRLILYSDNHSLDELMEETLNEAETLTGSSISFYHFVDDDQNSLILQNWSTRTKKEFCTAEGKGSHYEITRAGVWVDCFHQRKPVIHNDYASLPNKKGMPPGHAMVVRELVVPVIRENKIKALLGVGNKPSNYYEPDVNTISEFADLVWDITERKKSEEVLLEKTNFINKIIETSSLSTWISDEHGTAIQVNPACLKFFGATETEVIGKYNLLKDEIIEKQGFMPEVKKVFEKGEVVSIVVDYDFGAVEHVDIKNATHKILNSIFTPILDTNNKVTNVIVQSIDLTERIQAEKELRTLLELYERSREALLSILEDQKEAQKALTVLSTRQEAILSAVPDFIMEVDKNKVYTWANQSGIDFFGEDVIGKEAAFYFEGEQNTYNVVQPLFEGSENVVYVESWQRRKDGQKRLLGWWCRMLKDEKGNVTGALSSACDLTENKYQEEELWKKNEELIRFTYAVSHDLKSPLVTIKTFTGFLEQDMQQNDEKRIKKDLGFIHTATDKMSQLLDELLDLSRIGRKLNPFEHVPLQNLVQEALSLVGGRIADGNVRVKVSDEPITLYGDRPRMVEIFQNLVDNAVKFMGGQQSPQVEIGAEYKHAEWVLFVRDNGIGIAPHYQSKLFGLFEKLNSDIEGTGMGLALVRRIVEVHGGKIWVESEGEGKGTTFKFTLAGTEKHKKR
jgi:PAS domain S-box-containing protein